MNGRNKPWELPTSSCCCGERPTWGSTNAKIRWQTISRRNTHAHTSTMMTWGGRTRTNMSTAMARIETNAKTTTSTAAKGHGAQSSPSHPPLGRGEAMCALRHFACVRSTACSERAQEPRQERDAVTHWTEAWHAMARRMRAGHRQQSMQCVPGNTLPTPRAMASPPLFTAPTLSAIVPLLALLLESVFFGKTQLFTDFWGEG